MREGKTIKELFGPLSVGKLIEAKRHALRRGVWFRALTCVERGIIDLTVKYVDNIKSTQLAKVLTAIIKKLETTTESIIDKLVRTIGLPLTRKISNIAVNWGNRFASAWADDPSFARFLAVNFAKT